MIETLSAIRDLREVGIRIVFIEDGLDSVGVYVVLQKYLQ